MDSFFPFDAQQIIDIPMGKAEAEDESIWTLEKKEGVHSEECLPFGN